MQEMALIISFIVIGFLAFIFLIFIKRSQVEGGHFEQPKAEGLRMIIIAAFALFTAVIAFLTLKPWPHSAEAGVSGAALTVKVSGAQWYWDVSHEELPVNTPILFEVTASDVNHGFGIYGPKGRLLSQTQAMPGYVNKLLFTFKETGTFKVLCLEFCGPAHHDMVHEFNIVAKNDFKGEE